MEYHLTCSGMSVHDVWEDGEDLKQIRIKIANLTKEKDELEAARKKLARLRTSAGK